MTVPARSTSTIRTVIAKPKLAAFAEKFVEGTGEGSKVLRSIYPKHLYDSQRRKMATELAGKEIAKITDIDKPEELGYMQSAVKSLYEGREGVYAPVHDFWSFVEMVLHVKKKELPELITAENISWQEKDLDLDKLHLTWMPFLEQHPKIFGPKPWKVSDIKRLFKEDPGLLSKAKRHQLKTVGKQPHNFDQSEEPITLLNRAGKIELIDGNGRIYRRILEEERQVKGYVGHLHDAMPYNYWISAGSLKQFCLEIRGYRELNLASFEDGLDYLRARLRHNTPALINYVLFLRTDFPELEDGLKEVLPAPVNQSQV